MKFAAVLLLLVLPAFAWAGDALAQEQSQQDRFPPVSEPEGPEANGVCAAGKFKLPKPSFSPRPKYPEKARARGVEGRVMVQVRVDTGGAVHDAIVLQALEPMIDAAVLDVVKRWRFEPAECDGEPIEVKVSIPFVFRLE